MGNILTATRNGVTTSYTYDNLGQLTRVDDPSDTTSGSAGTTWVYDYDRGGNILTKKRYAYTTGTLGTALETVTYSYNDSNWKDKMTAYNGTAISYDSIGNPTNDGTWTYTWEKGRQLKQMSKSGTTATFLYNADGLRIRKTVGSTVTNYTLHGKNIVHLTQGSNSLHFFYDAQNRPAIVNYNGTKYAYQYSLQGDVIGLIDTNGTQVVRYVYDAWGRVLSTTGSLASTLGTIQPFRYRGYVYDVETGLYYLRSRYYNPIWQRFTNADTRINENVYSYCSNTPVYTFDQDGHKCKYCGGEHIPLTGNYGDNLPTIRRNGLHRNEKKRIPWCQFIEWAYQMYTEGWEYAPRNEGEGIWYGHVDCSGIHRLIIWWYYSSATEQDLKIGSSTAGGIYESAVYNNPFPSRNVPIGKGNITESTILVPGMGLFREGYNENNELTKVHMAIYVGDYFPGYTNAVIEAVEGGVVIRSLEDSERENGPFTHCGYFKGVAYQ